MRSSPVWASMLSMESAWDSLPLAPSPTGAQDSLEKWVIQVQDMERTGNIFMAPDGHC